MKSAKIEWSLLFGEDAEAIWNSERTELRNAAMLFYVLKKEFKKIETNLSNEMTKCQEKLQNLNSIEVCDDDSCTPELFTFKVLQKSKDVIDLNNSPRKNKARKVLNLERDCTSPSLLDVQKENHKATFIKPQLKSGKSPFAESVTPIQNNDVVDCSIIEEVSPNVEIKNVKHPKNSILNHSSKKRKKGICTLTQLFGDYSLVTNQSNTLNDSNVFKFHTKKNHNETESNNKVNKKVVHPYKTDPVRRKADRMKLPGWSCADCQKYYESLNLPPDELKQKMNLCSKHRNKFKPLDETIKGYWDITMCSTQENDTDATMFEN